METLQVRGGIARTDDEEMAINLPGSEWQATDLTFYKFRWVNAGMAVLKLR
jgi:hypothetical protein